MQYKTLRDKVEDLPSYILDDDFRIYARYLPFIPDNESIVDLATGWGKSAIAMALANPDILVWTIDDGSYPIYQGYAKDIVEYKKKIAQECKNHKADNVTILIGDFSELAFQNNKKYSLIHFDMTKEVEVNTLMLWLPKIKKKGLALIRNYERMKDEIDSLLTEFEEIDTAGLIHVFRRI